MLALTPTNGPTQRNVWKTAFSFLASIRYIYNSVLDSINMNLSASQKETLLWHQQLSNASLSLIQLLIQDRVWLHDQDSDRVLHQGPCIQCVTPCSGTSTISCLKCPSCLTAKTTICTPSCQPIGSGLPPHNQDQEFTVKLEDPLKKVLKMDHLEPSNYISTNHLPPQSPDACPTHLAIQARVTHMEASLSTMQVVFFKLLPVLHSYFRDHCKQMQTRVTGGDGHT